MNPPIIARNMGFALLLAGGGWLFPAAAHAADAAFCADGSAVYATCNDENTLERICEEEGTLTQVHVSLGGRQGCFQGIARSDQGGFFLVTERRIWHWKPGDKAAVFVKLAPKGITFSDIACNPKNGMLLIFGSAKKTAGRYGVDLLYCMKDKNALLTPIWLRHLTQPVVCAEFLTDNSLLFGTEGDLWHGVLCIEPPDKERPEGQGELVAYRYAPVAERFNYNGTPEQRGVEAVAASGGKAYVAIKRMGGSGETSVTRLDLPEPSKDGMFRTRNTVEDSIRVLKSVEQIDGNDGSASSLCASSDGKQVYYTDSSRPNRTHYLCEDDGETRPFRAKHMPVAADGDKK